MRFDDRMETVLGINPATDAGRAALWSQLVDLMARDGAQLPEPTLIRAFRVLGRLRPIIAPATRRTTARAVSARLCHAPTLVWLARDTPPVVGALMAKVDLPDADWIAALPELSPLARSHLRRRDDLSPRVRAGLAALGSVDFALSHNPLPAAVSDEAPAPTSDIAQLVRRIEAYRIRHEEQGGGASGSIGSPSASQPIEFRADVDGAIRSVSGVRRGLIVGLTLASAARPGETGVDAGVARAFAKRTALHNGRLMLAHPDGSVHHFIINADPQFDRANGRFTGYFGTIRPSPVELAMPLRAASATDMGAPETDVPEAVAGICAADPEFPTPTGAEPPAGEQPLAGAVRQLVHELRSPLNAIQGFAQLIEGQYFGPVSARYRDIARAIMADSRYLTGAFEDMDLAARLDTNALAAREGASNIAAALVAALNVDNGVPQTARIIGLDREVMVALPEREADRMVSLIISALQGQLADGDVLTGTLSAFSGRAVAALWLDLPITLADGMVQRAISGEACNLPHNDSGFGFSFSLQLAARLASAYGGELYEAAGQLILNLPLVPATQSRFEVAV